VFTLQGEARRTRDWRYEELVATSDVIVIAIPVEVRKTSKSTTVPGVLSQDQNGDQHSVIAYFGVTKLQILAVLKGKLPKEHIFLRHLYRNTPPTTELNGLSFLEFIPNGKTRFLLFLKQEGNEFVPVAGQTDPWFSVKDLGTYP
jgi:hypothetical protein